MGIKEALSVIKNASYGRQIRQAIYDAVLELDNRTENSCKVASAADLTAHEVSGSMISPTFSDITGDGFATISNGKIKVGAGKYLVTARLQASYPGATDPSHDNLIIVVENGSNMGQESAEVSNVYVEATADKTLEINVGAMEQSARISAIHVTILKVG